MTLKFVKLSVIQNNPIFINNRNMDLFLNFEVRFIHNKHVLIKTIYFASELLK